MDNDTVDFCSKNFCKLLHANKLYGEFLSEIIKKIESQFPATRSQICRNFGDEFTTAIRFSVFPDNETDVVLILNSEGTYSVAIYIDPKMHNKSSIKIDGKYKSWREGNWECFALTKENEKADLTSAIEEIKEQVENLLATK